MQNGGLSSNNDKKTNGVVPNGARLKKNFASPDCGAKIVGSNPESQGANNVISSTIDEYFLNKCSHQAWFVVELCESIKAIKFEIANFELFSSLPKEVRKKVRKTGSYFKQLNSVYLSLSNP